VLTFGVIALAAPCSAQNMPRGEISGGWQLFHTEEQTLYAGWYGDVVGNLSNMVGVVGEVSGAYKSVEETRLVQAVRVQASGDLSVHSFMGGLRLNARQNPRIVPFGQITVGGVRGKATFEGSTTVGGRTFSVSDSTSETDFALGLGAGTNLMLSDTFGVQATVRYMRIFAEDEDSNATRFGVGAVIAF
jgi:opacity protein-like surface antigen